MVIYIRYIHWSSGRTRRSDMFSVQGSMRNLTTMLKWWITDDTQSMEVSGYLCTLTGAGLVA